MAPRRAAALAALLLLLAAGVPASLLLLSKPPAPPASPAPTPSDPIGPVFASLLALPIYFHVLLLVSLGLWCWAVNVHGLAALGIDALLLLEGSPLPILAKKQPGSLAASLDSGASAPSSPLAATKNTAASHASPGSHTCLSILRFSDRIRSLYAIAAATTALSLVALAVFAICSRLWGQEPAEAVPALVYIAALAALAGPWRSFFHRERTLFLRSLGRTMFGGLTSPIPLSDIVLADVLTSFSRVIGDMQLVICDLALPSDNPAHPSPRPPIIPLSSLSSSSPALAAPAHINSGIPGHSPTSRRIGAHWTNWLVPALVLLPFIFRLRQCLAEYLQSHSRTSRNRHLANALKYFSSIPVVVTSFTIGRMHDLAHVSLPLSQSLSKNATTTTSTMPATSSTDHGAYTSHLNTVIGFWIIFSVINTTFSLYWDVFVDWDLGHASPVHSTPCKGTPPHASVMVSSDVENLRVRSRVPVNTASSVLMDPLMHQPIGSTHVGGRVSTTGVVASPDVDRGLDTPAVSTIYAQTIHGNHDLILEDCAETLYSPPTTMHGVNRMSSHHQDHHHNYHDDDDDDIAGGDTTQHDGDRNTTQNHTHHRIKYPLLRQSLHFITPIPYYLAILTNTLLRLSWIPKITLFYRLVELHAPGLHHVVEHAEKDAVLVRVLMATDLVLRGVEILRRCLWVFFRLEREWVARYHSSSSSPSVSVSTSSSSSSLSSSLPMSGDGHVDTVNHNGTTDKGSKSTI